MYLGLDLGTSGIKGVLLDHQGALIDQASAALTVATPQPNWSEQNPEDWWQATISVLMQLKQAGHELQQVQALGLSGQMHGATLLDQKGAVIRPCILWNDGRSYPQCERLMASHPELMERSGNLAMPGFTAPKIQWVREHEPENFARIAKVLLPKDYLLYRLTGAFSSDCSDAAGTLWLNPATRQWDETLLQLTGLTLEHMPKVHEGHEVVATLREDIAAELGLAPIPVVAGGGDNACGAVGMGVTNPGQGFVSLGTSGVYFSVSDAHNAAPEHTVHAFCHALPNRWHQMGVTLSAANSLAWFAGVCDSQVPVLLNRLYESDITQTRVVYLPYLNGERTPINAPDARGQFYGMSNGTSQMEMTLAILEGVAFSMLDCQHALAQAGTDVDELSLIGGGARSALWRQILADTLGKTIVYRDGGEVGPGLGAARLALLGHRASQGENVEDLIQAYCPLPKVLDTHQPQPDKRAYYQGKYAIYRELYQQTKTLEGALASLF